MKDTSARMWRKSTYSGNNGGNCVEIGTGTDTVLVRDTKNDGTGPVLSFTPETWTAFSKMLKASLQAQEQPPRCPPGGLSAAR
jgi:hypothetical protein